MVTTNGEASFTHDSAKLCCEEDLVAGTRTCFEIASEEGFITTVKVTMNV